MSVCAAIKPDGVRCKARAMKGTQWCFNHDPDYSQERQRNASKGGRRGGRGRPGRPGSELHTLLEDLTQRVIDGKLDTSRGAVAAQLINTRIRLLGHELKVREAEELEERIEELEAYIERGGRSYGA